MTTRSALSLLALSAALVLSVGAGGCSTSPARAEAATFDASVRTLLPDVLKIGEALAADRTDGVAEAAGRIAAKATGLDTATAPAKHAEHYKAIPAKVKDAAARLAAAKDVEAMRAALKELSRPLAMWVGMSGDKTCNVAYCGMAGSSWLQKGKDIRNPYFGAKMLHCGEIVGGPDAPKKEAPKGKPAGDGHDHKHGH